MVFGKGDGICGNLLLELQQGVDVQGGHSPCNPVHSVSMSNSISQKADGLTVAVRCSHVLEGM